MPTLSEACGVLLLNDPTTFKDASETLFKILQNIAKHPDEPKYRSLARSSAAFTSKLANAKGAVRFLKAVGFEEEGGSGELREVSPSTAGRSLLGGEVTLEEVVGEDVKAVEEGV